MTKLFMTAALFCFLLQTPAAAADRPPVRRVITALEKFTVIACYGDESKYRVSRSRAEYGRETAVLAKECPRGTVASRVRFNCGGGSHYQLIESLTGLDEFLTEIQNQCGGNDSEILRTVTRQAYLKEVEAAGVDFDQEVLLLIQESYGGTGQASSSMDFSEREEVLTVSITIRVPPPPVTPDTAVFYYAVTVPKETVRRVLVSVNGSLKADLPVSRG